MNQSPLHTDEDQDSLFGSPPPSPARGRSPSQETLITGEVRPIIALPSTGVSRENVGTIALPGSHMSCAELPADLPASGLLFPRPTSSRGSLGVGPSSIAGTPTSVHTPAVTSRSSARSAPSRAPSTAGTVPAATRKRRTPKAKSLTPIPPAPPITLPGPDEPTPPNFLRSQSSLLGLAGLVGCVKPAQLYTHAPHTLAQPSRSDSPVRGSTPTHPIVLDDQDTPHIAKYTCGQLEMPQCLDQFDPETLHSKIMNSLTKENNIFPVLESLIKLLRGLHLPSTNPPLQPFTRPYGHGIFNAQPSPVSFVSTPDDSTIIPAVPPPKRRKLKHVPAGAVDWDVPFPFAAGEGPEEYRDTWAQDRTKQLATQLLQLVQNAARRAAIQTAKSGRKVPKGRTRARNPQSSRSASVETQIGQISLTQANIRESPLYTTNPNAGGTVTGTPADSLGHLLGSLETPSTGSPVPGFKDRTSVDLEGAVEEPGSEVPHDYSAFEEWLSQLQQFVPLETNAPALESDWARLSVSLDSSAPIPAPDALVRDQRDASTTPHAIQDEVIDPALLAVSQQAGSPPQPQLSTSPMPTLAPGDISQMLDIFSAPPALAPSPRTLLSSLTEPLTPLSEASADTPTSVIAHQDLVRGMHLHPSTTRGCAYKSYF